MTIERRDVERIAELARLRLSDGELDRFTTQLGSILGHMDRLAELDSEGLRPETARGPEAGTPLRAEDAPPDALALSPAQMAPDWRDGLFVVPKLAAQEHTGDGDDPADSDDPIHEA